MAYQITKGMQMKPVKACVYGVEGVGKTLFAAQWPGAVFIDVEDGSGHYDVARFPRPDGWLGLLAEIEAAAKMDEVGTLIIDTADAAEALCTSHVCLVKKWNGIEDIGYGKGYTYLAEEFSKLTAALDDVVAAGKNVLVVAHAQIKKFEQPDEMGAYDRWELKLQKKDASILKEWCDLLLFANYKADMMKDEQTKKFKATGGKRRMMYAAHTAAFDAKNRLGLPDEMPFEFPSIAHAIPNAEISPTEPKGEPTPAPEQEKPKRKPAQRKTAQKKAEPKEQPAEQPEKAAPAELKPEKAEPAPIDVNKLMKSMEDVTPPEIKQLHQLMADYGVTDAQLKDAVGSRKNNPYTGSTPICDYSSHFVKNTLLKHWEAIVATIKERSDMYKDVPFD